MRLHGSFGAGDASETSHSQSYHSYACHSASESDLIGLEPVDAPHS